MIFCKDKCINLNVHYNVAYLTFFYIIYLSPDKMSGVNELFGLRPMA